MVRRLVAFITTLILSVTMVSQSYAVYDWETTGNNLIHNSDFANSVGSWYQQLFGIFEYIPDEGHNGIGCGLVKGRTAIDQQVYQPVMLEEGETYIVSAWVKLKNAEDEKNGTITLITSNSTIIADHGRSVNASASQWKELCVAIVADNPSQNVYVGLANFTDVKIEFYIDDVSVLKVDTDKLYPVSLTLNGATATSVPENGVNQIHLRCDAINQLGGKEGMHDISGILRWYLEENAEGVFVDSEGVVTVETVANPGKVTVCAEVDSDGKVIKASKEIEILPVAEFKDGGNLFCNGDFENTGEGEWIGDNIKILSEKSRDDGFSAFVPDGGMCGQYLYLKPGKKYLATAMINANNISDEFLFVTDNKDIGINTKSVEDKNEEWHRVFAVLNTENLTQNTKVLVSIASKENSGYYADSFFIGEMVNEFSDYNAEFSYVYDGEEKPHLINGDLSVRAKLANGIERKELVIATAVYNDKNEVKDIGFINDISLDEFEEKTVDFESKFNITDCTKQKVRLFVWRTNLSPDKVKQEVRCSDEIILHVNKNVETDSEKNIFSTIPDAVRKINQLKTVSSYPKDGITIVVHEGVYQNERMLFLDENWRKPGDKPLTIKAADGEKVLITGDINISGDAFQEASDSEKARLVDEKAREHLVKIDLKAQGITDFGELSLPGTYQLDALKNIPTMPELVINGKVMNVARYPNEGYMSVTEVLYSGADAEHWTSEEKANPTEKMLNDGFVIKPEDDRFKNWIQADDAVMYGYWNLTWVDQAVPIAAIDNEEGTITGKHPTTRGIKNNGYFYTYNLLEEIDSPGEYYIDRENGILYLYPPQDTDLSNAEISVTRETNYIIWFRNTYDFVIDGITFANSRGSAIMFEGGTGGLSNVVFKNCSFKNLGSSVSKTSGKLSEIGFYNCTFVDVNGGVKLSGGDFKSLTPGNCFVENCSFDNFSRITETYNPAIAINGVGLIAKNNTIRNAPHSAITFYGNDHIIEYNDISGVLTEGSDMAAIYAGKSWKSRGTKIRNNYIHDINSNIVTNKDFFGGRTGIYGIYFDDMLCDVEVSGNIFADFGGYGVLINGGRDNIVKNNVFVNTLGSLYVTAIGTEAGKDMSVHYNDLEIVKNDYDSDFWYKRYPELYCIRDNEPLLPVDNVFEGNFLVNSGYINIDKDAKALLKNENNLSSAAEEAGFLDYYGKDYRIDKNAEVFKIIKGFYQISPEKTGIKEDLK